MLIKQDGNLRKRPCTHIYALYVCTFTIMYIYISDVSKRGVLGSADDDIAFFSAYCDIFLLIMGRSIIFHCFFVILTMCFIIFHCFFPNYMVQPKVILPPLVERHGFQEKARVPHEKSGRHSNLIYLVLNPLKKSGTAFGDLSVFWRCCSLLFSVFLFWRCCFIDSNYFEDVSSLFFNDFSLFSRCVSLFFVDFSMLLITCFSLIF